MNKKLQRLLMGLVDGFDQEQENKQMKEIFKLQKKNKDRLLEEVAKIVVIHEIADNLLDIKVKDRRKLKREVSKLINTTTSTEHKVEADIINEALQSSAVERYLMNNYFYGKTFQIDYDLQKLSSKRIKKIINQKVKVANSSAWQDLSRRQKKTLNKKLRKELYGLMDGKTNINKVMRNIEEEYGKEFGRSRRLVRTESARVQGSVNEEWAKDNGIEQQMWTATLDNRTSVICQDLDGNFYDFDDPDKPIEPMHPNCRSALVNVPYEGWKPTVRRDNITKENINYQTYKEWAKKNR